MAGIILCVFVVVIIAIIAIIEGVLDRLHERELQFQQEEAARKKAASRPSVFKFVNTRITLQDVQDYVKQYPPVGQMQCTGCHTVCKDDCDHTCGGKCSAVCNNSCLHACVGVCGGGCSGEATAIGTNEF